MIVNNNWYFCFPRVKEPPIFETPVYKSVFLGPRCPDLANVLLSRWDLSEDAKFSRELKTIADRHDKHKEIAKGKITKRKTRFYKENRKTYMAYLPTCGKQCRLDKAKCTRIRIFWLDAVIHGFLTHQSTLQGKPNDPHAVEIKNAPSFSPITTRANLNVLPSITKLDIYIVKTCGVKRPTTAKLSLILEVTGYWCLPP